MMRWAPRFSSNGAHYARFTAVCDLGGLCGLWLSLYGAIVLVSRGSDSGLLYLNSESRVG